MCSESLYVEVILGADDHSGPSVVALPAELEEILRVQPTVSTTWNIVVLIRQATYFLRWYTYETLLYKRVLWHFPHPPSGHPNRWPHLGNALKYATAMSVSLFGMYQPGLHTSWLWMFSFVVATLYQFSWDIAMDWDLLRWWVNWKGLQNRCSIMGYSLTTYATTSTRSSILTFVLSMIEGKHDTFRYLIPIDLFYTWFWRRDGRSLRLRPRLLYRNKIAYVAVALVNLGLRFLWTVTLLPENTQMFSADFNVYMSPFIAAAEIIRRLVCTKVHRYYFKYVFASFL